jgi:hypothetical protein
LLNCRAPDFVLAVERLGARPRPKRFAVISFLSTHRVSHKRSAAICLASFHDFQISDRASHSDLLSNVKDEPRLCLARLVRQHEA